MLKMSKTFFKMFKSVLDRQKSLIFCLWQNQNFDYHRNLNLADSNSPKYSKCEKNQFFQLRSAKKIFNEFADEGDILRSFHIPQSLPQKILESID